MSDFSNRDRGPDLRDQFREDYARQQSELSQRERTRSKKWMWIVGGILAFGLLFGGCGVSTYNTLQKEREEVRIAFSNVDTSLQRRADLIPNLVNTVKGYAKHEEKIFTDIADARARLLGAQTPEDKSAANDQLNSTLGRLLVLTENYPDLKANQQFQTLMAQLEGTENRIRVAREDYNKEVLDYNVKLQRFPTVIIGRLLGFERAEEFKAAASAREVPQVDFNK
jgi:LemA protein